MHAFYLYRTSENYLEQLQKPITMSVYYRQNIIYTPQKNSKASSVDAFILLIDGKWKIKNRLKKN